MNQRPNAESDAGQIEAVEKAIRSALLGDLEDDGPLRIAVLAVNALRPWLNEPTMAFFACGLPKNAHPRGEFLESFSDEPTTVTPPVRGNDG